MLYMLQFVLNAFFPPKKFTFFSCGQLGSVDVRALFVSTNDLVVDKLGWSFGVSLYTYGRRSNTQKAPDYRVFVDMRGIGRRSCYI